MLLPKFRRRQVLQQQTIVALLGSLYAPCEYHKKKECWHPAGRPFADPAHVTGANPRRACLLDDYASHQSLMLEKLLKHTDCNPVRHAVHISQRHAYISSTILGRHARVILESLQPM